MTIEQKIMKNKVGACWNRPGTWATSPRYAISWAIPATVSNTSGNSTKPHKLFGGQIDVSHNVDNYSI
jgi:hypothetical protein